MRKFEDKQIQLYTLERATWYFDLGRRNERGYALVEWATSNEFKIMNTQFRVAF